MSESKVVRVRDLIDRLARCPADAVVVEEADRDTPDWAIKLDELMRELREPEDDSDFGEYANEYYKDDNNVAENDEDGEDEKELSEDDLLDNETDQIEYADQDEEDDKSSIGNDPRPRDERDVPWSDIHGM